MDIEENLNSQTASALPFPRTVTIRENVLAEVVRLLFMQINVAVLGSLITATCLVIGLYGVIPTSTLLYWYLSVIVIACLRYGLSHAYRLENPGVDRTKLWLFLFFLATVAGGITWMLAGTLLLTTMTLYQALVTFAIAGIVAGSVPFFSPNLVVAVTYILLVLPPFGIKMWSFGGVTHHLLAMLSLVYSAVLILSAARINKAILNALKLKFENLELIQRLSSTKQEVEKINQELQDEINERKQIEKLLRNSEEQYRLVTDALPVLISYIDSRLRFRFNNRAFEEWFGKPIDQITGKEIKSIIGDTAFATFHEHYQKALAGNQVTYEATMYFHEEQERYVSVTLIPHVRDGIFRGVFSLISDMTPRINYLATHDPLTSLPNRSLFNARLTRSLKHAHRNNSLVGLMFLDLDHFKNVNDTLGHDVGDQLLIKVVERLQSCVGERDTLARLGGDEFIIIMEDITNTHRIIALATSICKQFSKVFRLDPHNLFITTSIGISVYPGDGDNMQILMKNADMAMYRAKERGRNTFEFYTQGMNETIQKKISIESSLRTALHCNELMLYYQPVINVHDHSISSFEALIRWNHPEMGLVPPADFIPIAEESDLIISIGAWVLQAACLRSVQWQRAGFAPARMSVNLSARQFMKSNLPEMVDAILNETGMEGKNLTMEITESLIMQDIDHSVHMINKLKSLDISISLDDFGTGYSSLSYLKRFPFDIIKIDRAFITDFKENPGDAAIVRAIISMAHSLKMKVVAEGIEKQDQFEFMREHGCDEIQGFYVCPPLPEYEIDVLLKKNKVADMPER